MKNWRNVWWVSLAILVLVSLTLSNIAIADGKNLKDGYITRDRMMEIAEAYESHTWNPSEDNIYHDFCNGKRVDTPDNGYPNGWWIPNQINIGVPYQWGGFSSISGFDLVKSEDFDEQIQNKYHAGDISIVDYECPLAAGVDCSGFVGRCWNLSKPKPGAGDLRTKEFSWPIKFENLKSGDILNTPGHVMLFKEFSNPERTRVRVYEASGWDWKVSEREYEVGVLLKDLETNKREGYGAKLTHEGVTKDYWAYTYNPIKWGLIWLREHQNSDGSWTYSGRVTEENVGLTSMATLAYLNYGIDESDPTVRNALDWILSKQQGGKITNGWYHTYDTSLATLALVATRNDDYYDEIQSAVDFLISIQNDEDTGYSESDMYYGGWPYWEGMTNWADLSNSQFVLLALHFAEQFDPSDTIVPADVWSKAEIFVTRCQNREASNPDYNFYDDGGFIYMPSSTIWAGGQSYASITTAGLWGLYTCGVSESDGRAQDAWGWVENNYYVDRNYPIGNLFLYYYHYSLAKACILGDVEEINGHDWYDEMSDVLVNNQQADGHWPETNPSEEPDNVATCWALLALISKQIPPGAGLSFEVDSPADLHVYDPKGRHVGIDYETGLVEIEIPGATYSGPGTEPQVIYIPNPIAGTYNIELIGTASGEYTYTVRGLIDGTVISEKSYTSSITPGEVHESTSTVSAIAGAITVETNAIPVGDANGPYTGVVDSPITFDGTGSDDPDGTIVSYAWDLDDDGEFDDAFGATPIEIWNTPYSGNISLKVTDDDGAIDVDSTTLTVDVKEVIPATVDFNPDTLSLRSKGKWVTTYIELPEGYDVADIDVSTIMLNDQVPAEMRPIKIGDHDDDGIADLMVKFDMPAVQGILEVEDEVEITVTGELTDGMPFEGSDTIRVIDEG